MIRAVRFGIVGILGLGLASLAPAADPPAPQVDLESWCYTTPRRPALPDVLSEESVRNPIDRFIQARLERASIAPVGEADKTTLIRRVTFDLTGLPPAPDETARFLADEAPDAYGRLVDRLLASPRFGERWARHWLDLVRYADSNGFKTDATRPNAYRYRDYVIASLNADKPYDRFTIEQLAGDEAHPGDLDALLATGFYRHYPDEDNARNLPQRRQEILDDITDTVASTFMGLTFSCARCHDHKYDPILQEDYYRLQAFFVGFKPDDVPIAELSSDPEVRQRLRAWSQQTADLRERLHDLTTQAREKYRQEKLAVFPAEVREAVLRQPTERSPLDRQIAHMVAPQIEMGDDELAKKMSANSQWKELVGEMKRFDHLKVDDSRLAMAYVDVGRDVPTTHVLLNGVFGRIGREVAPQAPSALSRIPIESARPTDSSSGRRLALAHWLTGPDHPLFARVIVNRLWHHHFGRGLVENPGDFGVQGLGPSHPELLDWLATELVRQNYSLKAMHRLLVTSSAYRRSNEVDANAVRLDPENRLWWRRTRQRLEAEAARDALLAVAGVLDPRLYGPGVFPPVPEELKLGKHWPVSSDPADFNRASIYVFVRRNTKYPLLDVMDLPDANIPCACRNATTTAPQALQWINSSLVLGYARAFAGRVIREADESGSTDRDDTSAWTETAYRLCFSRRPSDAEQALARQFLQEQADWLAERPEGSLALPTGGQPRSDVSPARAAALVDFCHALLNTNEFLFVD